MKLLKSIILGVAGATMLSMTSCNDWLDVNDNPDNPAIGMRSFGENPDVVARHGIAFARGVEDNGVLTVAKHFPGHGNPSSDSHKTLPTDNKTRS